MNLPLANTCILIGAGGHARVLLDILLGERTAAELALLDADKAKWGTNIMGVQVLGGDELLNELGGQNRRFAVSLGSTAATDVRMRIFDRALSHGLQPMNIIHRAAVVSKWSELSCGIQVLASAVINPGARVGRNVILNTAAIVEHDCEVGDHVHVATAARLCGGVRVGQNAHIGAGAVIRQGIIIGARATVGAGAVVVRDVAEGTTVIGSPAAIMQR